jgi:hypothetical protein
MPSQPARILTPEEEELERKRAQLAALEQELSERELDRATLQAELAIVEKSYLDVVGRKYAELDQLEAKIAEALAGQNPLDQAAQKRAEDARVQAEESTRTVEDREEQTRRQKGNQSASLRECYRQAAKLLHPDLTLDPKQKEIRQRLMAEVNRAYAEGDEERIRRILSEWRASPDSVEGEGFGVELVRVIRKIAQIQARLRAIATEMDQLRVGELCQLKSKLEEAHAQGLDLLTDLALRLDQRIGEARERLNGIVTRRDS